MNDNELFELLQGMDPLDTDARLTPAHNAQALSLMEKIMTAKVESPLSEHTTSDTTSTATTIFATPSRRRWYSAAAIGAAAAAVAAAAVAAAVVLPGVGGSTALAWTPVPRAATEADADVARQACVVPDGTDAATTKSGSRGDDARVDTITPAPEGLGSLTALDLRGNGGLAVFNRDEKIVMCMLRVVDGTTEYAGMISIDSPGKASDTLRVDGGMTTGIGSNTAVSMLTGYAGPAAVVEIRVDGLDPITATLFDGRFAAWWPEPSSGSGTSLDGPITIVSLAADGTELADIIWTGARQATDTSRITAP